MILLQDVHLKLAGPAGSVNILRGINLAVDVGETVSVVGPSGSGKTTMLMVIAGLERPTEGEVRVKGVDLGSLDEDGLALFRRQNMGIVFQNFHLVPTMTALENVAIPCEFSGHADAIDRASENLKMVGLGHRLHHYPGQLSGGEQQRTALARAFVAAPNVLLADEPTGNLDRGTGEAIIDLLFSLAEKFATTLLLITHDSAIGARCARKIRITDGRASDVSSMAALAPWLDLSES
ncbi:ABC transporter ATP-binding protein [Alphaproteobacteria bacterium]|nr:ABC transporter ATP-binding protein [Alphaproteobacteria bacterium]